MTRIRLPYVHEFVDRHGKPRRYVRRNGKRTPLPGSPGSPEFMAAYEAAVAAEPVKAIGAARTKPGTINALVVEYYGSARYQQAKPLTKSTYRNIIERFRAENGDRLVVALETRHVRKMVDNRASKPAAANHWLDMVGMLMRFAVDIGWRNDDPTRGVRKVRTNSAGYHSWTEEEIARFEARHPLGGKARLAFDLLLYTAQRGFDVARMGRQHVAGGAIRVKQEKTGAELEIPIHGALAASLAVVPPDQMIFLLTDFGKPFSRKGFGNWFKKRCIEADLPHCSAHGLRKAAARRLAEAGCSAHQIMAVTGHRTLAEAERYTRAADQKRGAQAAFAKLGRAQK